MPEVTAAMVKELRETSGAGMMDCKKALVEADGDMEQAQKILREKGLAAAAKKAGRVASEGLSYVYLNDAKDMAVVVEVNSETDFVAKNAEFQTFVNKVALQVAASGNSDIEMFLDEQWSEDSSITVKDALSQMIARIGENLSIRRFEKLSKNPNGVFASYIHAGGKVAVVAELEGAANDAVLEAGKNICMQIASMSPQFVTRADVSENFIQSEKEILTQQAKNDEKNQGKPDNIIEKMIEGRLGKHLRGMCLYDQEYVKDGDLTVEKYLEVVSKEVGSPVKVLRFVRFETGEGIAKKEENFAEEVSKAMEV
ncbi:MAG: translation elongation factor Ts [Defluviitaleaceae bacterium]|nr:translation elongation factor Ts [Defluviitaleaceae bacterium]